MLNRVAPYIFIYSCFSFHSFLSLSTLW